MSKVELTEIKVKLNDKEIVLTPEEAKELKDVLDDFFGRIEYVPSQPIIIEKEKWVEPYLPPQPHTPIGPYKPGPYYRGPEVTCITKNINED